MHPHGLELRQKWFEIDRLEMANQPLDYGGLEMHTKTQLDARN